MIPFKTTTEQVMKLASIMVEMEGAGLDRQFIVAASELARTDQGLYDLMALWKNTADTKERDDILADIQESIDDYQDAPASPVKKPFLSKEHRVLRPNGTWCLIENVKVGDKLIGPEGHPCTVLRLIPSTYGLYEIELRKDNHG